MSEPDPDEEWVDHLADADFPRECGDLLTSMSCFFSKAAFLNNGQATITLSIPREMKSRIIALSENKGLQLNVAFWEQKVDHDAELAGILGFDLETTTED